MTEGTTSQYGMLQRVERLERQNTYLKWLIALTLLVAISFLSFNLLYNRQASLPSEISAQSFALRDPDGRLRLLMSAQDNKATNFAVYDQNNNTRLLVSTQNDGETNFALLDEAKVGRISMGMNANGDPILYLADRGGKSRVQVYISQADASPVITLNDENERQLIRLNIQTDGNLGPYIAITDKDMKAIATLGVPISGNPTLRLSDGDGQETLSSP